MSSCVLCGSTENLKQLAERLQGRMMRTSKTLTCVPCIAANPSHKPEMGEPFGPVRTYAEMMTPPEPGS